MLKKFILNINQIFRTKDWLLTKYFFNLNIIWGISLLNGYYTGDLLLSSVEYLMYMLPMGALGYFINEIYDIEIDSLANKKNHTKNLSSLIKVIIIIFLLLLSLLPILVINDIWMYLLLLLIQTLSFLIYSATLFRLKTKSFGVFLDALFSFIIPGAMCFVFTNTNIMSYSNIPIFVLLLLIGIRSIINHQIQDIENDKKSNISTLVVKIGIKKGLLIRNIFTFVEILFFIILIHLLSNNLIIGFYFSIVLFFIFEVIINRKSTIEQFNKNYTVLINDYYNYYILTAISFAYILDENYYFIFYIAIYLLIRNFNAIYFNLKTIVQISYRWLYFKSIGGAKRLKNGVRKLNK